MSATSVKFVVASAICAMLSGPAVAGGYDEGHGYAYGGYGAGCDCAPVPQARLVETVRPVTYYVPRTVLVPQRAYVRETVLVAPRPRPIVQSYMVDQGPSIDLPAVHYRAKTVNYPSGALYPYTHSPRIYYGYGHGGGYGRYGRAYAGARYGYRGFGYGYRAGFRGYHAAGHRHIGRSGPRHHRGAR